MSSRETNWHANPMEKDVQKLIFLAGVSFPLSMRVNAGVTIWSCTEMTPTTFLLTKNDLSDPTNIICLFLNLGEAFSHYIEQLFLERETKDHLSLIKGFHFA